MTHSEMKELCIKAGTDGLDVENHQDYLLTANELVYLIQLVEHKTANRMMLAMKGVNEYEIPEKLN